MSKRNYTHVEELFPEIEAMLASGKTQREVAEHFGFRDKYVVKSLVKREESQTAEAGSRDYDSAQGTTTERC